MYLVWVLFIGVRHIADVSDILTLSISRRCHAYSKEVRNIGNTAYTYTCCRPKTELRKAVKAQIFRVAIKIYDINNL
jgi:hypothetical protein